MADNDSEWGDGACNNTLGWGLAQTKFGCATPCSDARVNNSDSSYDTTIASGATLALPDITVTDSNGSTFTAPAVTNVTCTPAVAPIGALLTKSGQTTSYRTGDDGDLEAGRATSFGVLLGNNPFGNDKRFTDELGGQTYTKNIVIDWSTYDGTNVLGYKRTQTQVNSGGWNNAIDACLAISIAPYTTGWRLANVNEWNSIMNRELSNPLNYSPFSSFTFNNTAHTSTSYKPVPSVYSWGINNLGNIFPKDKNESSSCLAVRNFTVTGTSFT